MFSIHAMIAHGVTYAYAAVLLAAAGGGDGGYVRGSIVPERLSVFGDGSEPQQRALVAKNSKKTAAPPSTRCNAGLFEGTWTYPNCDAATIEFTMGCTDNDDTTCSFQETIVVFAGEQEINACPLGGLFQDETGSNVAYNDSTGWCEIDYFHFTEDPCGLYPQLGMKAYIIMNENGRGPPTTMYLLFSVDDGETFYNADGDVRVATRISGDDRRELTWSSVATDSTELQRRRLCGLTKGVPECTLECKEERDDAMGWTSQHCCEDHLQSEDCILNSESSACNCSDNVKCYIDMRCKDNEIWQKDPSKPWEDGVCCDDKDETCKEPQCTLECKVETNELKKAGRECCKYLENVPGKCILNSKSTSCKCSSNKGRCYIDTRCDDNKTWQEDKGECRFNPGEVCTDWKQCTKGYDCYSYYSKGIYKGFRKCQPSP